MNSQTTKLLEKISKQYWWPNSSQIRRILENNKKSLEDVFFQNALWHFVSKYKKELRNILWKDKIDAEDYEKVSITNIEEIIEKSKINYRDSQEMAIQCIEKHPNDNIVISLTTGEWKTLIAFQEMLKYLKNDSKVYFATPTNNLSEQQYKDFLEFLRYNWYSEQVKETILLDTKKHSIDEIKNYKFIFLTHHNLEKIEASNEDFVVIDEIHTWESPNKTESGYNYPSFKFYNNSKAKWIRPRVLWLTALSTNQEKVMETFNIKEWFVASQAKYYKNRNYIFHSAEKTSALVSPEFFEMQKDIEDWRDYIINNIFKLLENVQNQNWVLSKEVERTFKKDNLKKRSYIDNEKKKQLLKNLSNRVNEKFTKEHYHELLAKILIWLLEKLNQLKKSFETQDYGKAQYKSEKLISEIREKQIKYIEKIENYKGNDEFTYRYYDAILKILQKLEKTYWMDSFHEKISNISKKANHPKLERTLEMARRNKAHWKTTLVFVEDKELINNFMEIAQKRWFKVWYIIWWNKNQKQRLIQNYTISSINSQEFDIVFTTSVMKLWVNFDISELVLYNLPKNEKDLLQFVGRIGRYRTWANVHFVYPKNTIEFHQQFSRKWRAEKELDKQFKEWEKIAKRLKWIKEKNEQLELF